jgi:hypothetical protein
MPLDAVVPLINVPFIIFRISNPWSKSSNNF